MGWFDDVVEGVGNFFESDPTETTSSTSSGKEKWARDEGKDLYQLGRAELGKGFKPYTDPLVADLTASGRRGIDLTGSSAGEWQGGLGSAKGVAAGQASGARGLYADTQKMMDPYVQAVIDATQASSDKAFAEQARKFNQMKRAGDMAPEGRWGAAEGAMTADYLLGRAQQEAQLRSKGFNEASDRSASQVRNEAQQAQTLANLEAMGVNLRGIDITRLMSADATERGIENEKLQARYGQFLREQGWDEQQISWLMSMLNQTPALNEGTATQSVEEGGSMFMDLAGLAAQAFGAAGKMKAPPPAITYAPTPVSYPPQAAYMPAPQPQ